MTAMTPVGSTTTPFAVTASATMELSPSRTGRTTFTVTNLTGRAVGARLSPRGGPGAEDTWFAVVGPVELPMAIGATASVEVKASIPGGAPTGDCSFALEVVAEDDTEVVTGQSVAFTIPVGGAAGSKVPWLAMVLVVVVVAALLGGGLFWYFKIRQPPVEVDPAPSVSVPPTSTPPSSPTSSTPPSAAPSVTPPVRQGPFELQRAKGEAMAEKDPLLGAIRDEQPVGSVRDGFFIGVGTEAANTLWGPGAQKIRDGLKAEQEAAFDVGAFYCLDKNNNTLSFAMGQKVIAADPDVRETMESQTPGLYWLGFTIGTGVFGDPQLGGRGNTEPGEGSDKIQAGLHGLGQQGFADAREFNRGRR
jgi:hypothetical protein